MYSPSLPFVLFMVYFDELNLLALMNFNIFIFLCLLLYGSFLRSVFRSVLWCSIYSISTEFHVPHLSLLSFWNSSYVCLLPFDVIPEFNKALVSFVNIFPSLFFRLDNHY